MHLLLKKNGNEENSPKSRTTANLKLLPFPLLLQNTKSMAD